MKITTTTANLLAALFVALMILFVSLSVNADTLNVYDNEEHHYDELVQGPPGVDGRDGASIKGDRGASGLNGSSYSNGVFNRSMAITGAFAGIPTSSHVDEGHGHTSMAVGVGGYADSQGVAIGITHMQDRLSSKAVIGVSGSQTIYGVGAGFTF